MYIVLEGADGSGKTSIAHRVVDQLVARGKKAVFISEPLDIEGSLPFRSILKGIKLDIKTQLLTFYSNRVHLSAIIKKHISEGSIVVSDRSHISSMVYQDGLNNTQLMRYLDAFVGYPTPDHIILLRRSSIKEECDDEIEKQFDQNEIRTTYDTLAPHLFEYYKPSCVLVHTIANNRCIDHATKSVLSVCGLD
ncbi:MAG: dTMP kinase [Bacteroidales bacterium]